MYQGHADQRYGHITYSHCGEDMMVLSLFELMGIAKPSYLDLGAHHPFTISNTALLYQRGSRGVNIEANPHLIPAFKQHRPEDRIINIGVGLERGKLPFYMYDKWSGRNSFVKEEMNEFEHVGHTFKITETLDIEVLTLNDIVNEYCNGFFPDFLTMDLEGLDEKVLMTASLIQGPKVICAELYGKDFLPLKRHLLDQGYFMYCRMMPNAFFVKKSLEHLLY